MNTNLNAETIEAILVGKFLYEEKQSASYSQRIQSALGAGPISVNTDSNDLSHQLKMVMATSIAKRLVLNDRTVPLFSIDDCDQLISDYIEKKIELENRNNAIKMFCTHDMNQEEVEQFVKWALDDGLCNVDDEDKQFIKEVTKPMINSMVESVMAMVGDSDPYGHYFDIIGAIEFLANEQSLPLDQPLSDELYDEVTRRIYTKEQYVALNEKALKLISDPESLLKALMNPMIDNLLKDEDPEFVAEMREEAESELKKIVSLQLAPLFDKLTLVCKEIVDEEIDRLYPQ